MVGTLGRKTSDSSDPPRFCRGNACQQDEAAEQSRNSVVHIEGMRAGRELAWCVLALAVLLSASAACADATAQLGQRKLLKQVEFKAQHRYDRHSMAGMARGRRAAGQAAAVQHLANPDRAAITNEGASMEGEGPMGIHAEDYQAEYVWCTCFNL